jgi:hypothetical protein
MLRAILRHRRRGSCSTVTMATTRREMRPRHRAAAQVEQGSHDTKEPFGAD